MGGSLHLVVVGGPAGLIDAAAERLAELERRWTRFDPASEVSMLNAARGAPCLVSAETAHLVETACLAWGRSGGLFDPTMLDAIAAAGYDRDLDEVRAASTRGRPATRHLPVAASGCAGIEADTRTGLVRLPLGVRIDPGGIGKGLAADLVADALIDAGADGALVNLGGDLRSTGRPPAGGWRVGVENPHSPHHLAATVVVDPASTRAAAATSSPLKRRWMTDHGPAHHLLDPHTGAPLTSALASITALAATAWWAEALTKAAFLSPVDEWNDLAGDGRLIGIALDGSVVDTDGVLGDRTVAA